MDIVKEIGKGVIISFLVTMILLFIFSIILTFSNIGENVINPVIIMITAVSILIGSSMENMKIKKQGLLNGGVIGALYILMIYFISSILNWNFSLCIQSIIMIIAGISFGMIGGIIGVNWHIEYRIKH